MRARRAEVDDEPRARATKDYDTAFRAAMDDLVTRLDPALREGHGDFTAQRTALEPVGDSPAQRTSIRLAYRGRSWATVQLEVAPPEGRLALIRQKSERQASFAMRSWQL